MAISRVKQCFFLYKERSIRAVSYASLANSLWALYERSGNDHHLNEAIDLDRKALALRPPYLLLPVQQDYVGVVLRWKRRRRALEELRSRRPHAHLLDFSMGN
jgi:hypothetical protein